ncbi:Hypothetical_protein [Hexamita inflata]|uniref:Hypothetical_protein n=1 Tax=Hexamita inflata TaxID=28002 RepID=A0AA86PAQ7_9EUKA|nr:Hypothetical protein HINF_LOCUS21653 [Hexamita inflata]
MQLLQLVFGQGCSSEACCQQQGQDIHYLLGECQRCPSLSDFDPQSLKCKCTNNACCRLGGFSSYDSSKGICVCDDQSCCSFQYGSQSYYSNGNCKCAQGSYSWLTYNTQCEPCWDKQMIVGKMGCKSCQSNDINSLFAVKSKTCQCIKSFKLKNGVCEKTRLNQSSIVAIAVCVPISVVILVTLLIVAIIIKKKQQTVKQENDQPKEMKLIIQNDGDIIREEVVDNNLIDQQVVQPVPIITEIPVKHE